MLSLFTIVFIAFAQITVCLAQSRFAPAYYPAQPYLYATQPHYASQPYVLLYPEKQFLIAPQESSEGDEDGDKFWQTFFSYFSSCDSDLDGGTRKLSKLEKFPNSQMQMTNMVVQVDKIGEKPNGVIDNKIEPIPQKPFYFIIPPANLPSNPVGRQFFFKPRVPLQFHKQ